MTTTRSKPKAGAPRAAAAPRALVDERLSWVLLGIVLVAVAIVRWRCLDAPLERDEGEFAYAGQLIEAGIPPYKLAYNMKLPGTYLAYAALMAVFGQTVRGVHLGLLALNLGAIVLVWLLARRLAGPLPAVAAAASYAVLSASYGVQGLAGHATHVVVLFGLAALVLLARDEPRPGTGDNAIVLASGVLLGFAFLAKQPGAVFAVPALFLLARPLGGATPDAQTIARRGAMLIAGAALPCVLVAAWLAAAGVFGRFWFWTVSYAWQYATETGLGKGLDNFAVQARVIVVEAWPLWVLTAAAGVLAARRWRDRRGAFVALLFAASFVGVCPGLYFRAHYFVVLLPAAALVLAAGLEALPSTALRRAALAAVGLAVVHAGFVQRDFFFTFSPVEIARASYASNPFPESAEIAGYIAAHSAPDARVAVIGSEPQIYFLSKRRSATGFIYMYGLMENQPYAAEMQRNLVEEIEAGRPEWVVYVNVATSWLAQPGSKSIVFDWAQQYVPRNYDVVGIIDVPEDGRPSWNSRWDAAAKGGDPVSPSFVLVGRRKPGSPA